MSADEVELHAWLALSLHVRGTSEPWLRAIAGAGGARRFLEASPPDLDRLEASDDAREIIRAARKDTRVEGILAHCRRHGIAVSSFACAGYPARLREIRDPPFVIYHLGPPPAETDPAVAVVGSRRATHYGRATARRVARELAAGGITVISGLAYGVDAAAHRGALETGRSAAVVAGGLDCIYPRGHRELHARLVASAGVVSEASPGHRPRPYDFPRRNRLITGIARATVIVEASERSGSLVSARLALEQGRDLFAVPGNIDSPASRGTNLLIRDGCAPLLDVADVFRALGIEPRTSTRSQGFDSGESPDTIAIVDALKHGARRIDEVAQRTGMPGSRVATLLTELELAGVVERAAGGIYVCVRS